MATKAVPTEVLSAAQRKKLLVFVGVFPRKVKKADGTYDTVQRQFMAYCRKNTIDDLNLPAATPAQITRQKDGRDVQASGAKHGIKVLVPSPIGQKTAKGYLRQYEIMFPAGTKVKEMLNFFSKTKVESFKIAGGGSHGVTK